MSPTNLDAITDFPGLLAYLEEELDWPINAATFEEATFDFTAAELGLKDDAVGGPIEIKQLRKLTDNQPWGVFFLNLPQKKLPQTIVRNILGRLTVKKRQASNDPSRPAFLKSDLLFITSTGAGADRRLAFAHFQDDPLGGNAASLKILGWDGDDTPRRLALTKSTLATKLHWPDNPADTVHWRAQWSEAFNRADTRTVVRDSKAMAKALAALARRIRARAAELIEAQTADGSLVKLHAAFKEALIHDLTPLGFADTYAQTIAYGLLSTAISRASGAVTQDDMTANVAGTSPFLKEMLGQFIEAGGKKGGKAALDFDELDVGDVVELLRNADMAAVLADFDRKNPDEDPVIHFYELFLKEYDAEQKIKRGVFYTPRPVVGFIVRSVDEVLRTELHLADGLASTATWGEVMAASAARGDTKPITLPVGAALSDPFVRILDPATGTGTFLVECVDLIHKTMLAKWQAEKRSKAEIKTLWNDYVPHHLLPRLTGFELMMAPYAIAHVKLGLKLSDTGYTFGSDARAQIYLTNALEPAQDLDMQLAFMSEALAHEAKAANEAKGTRFTVAVGNPPYSVVSNNRSPWIQTLVAAYKSGLEERRIHLDDDYIKFFALVELYAKFSTVFVFGIITNNNFLDAVTFRVFRKSLLETTSALFITNLNGDVKRPSAEAADDENVFDIRQGVSVTVGIRMPADSKEVKYCSVVGARKRKYVELNGPIFRTPLQPVEPNFFFIHGFEGSSDYEKWGQLGDILPRRGMGIKTERDPLTIHWDREAAESTATSFVQLSVAELRTKYELQDDSRDWTIAGAKNDLTRHQPVSRFSRQIAYRPFDNRWTTYTGQSRGYIGTPSPTVSGDLTLDGNVALATCRQQATLGYQHVFCVGQMGECCVVSNRTREITSVFPLFLKSQGTETRTLPNIAPAFANRFAAVTGLVWDDCVGPKQGALAGVIAPKPTQTAMFATRRERGESGHSFGPRDLFDWIYAVLHSPTYRSRYADYLKSDFARVPLPGSAALFEALVPIGTDLVATHLLDAEHCFGADRLTILADPKGIRLAGSGEARVTQAPTFEAGRVYISGTRWFETVPEVAWNFHIGGYQPAQKWLKDRAAKKSGKKANPGRVLTDEDTLHYRRIILALTRTAELMPKIDKIIEEHGGWPGAFRGMADEVATEAST